MYAMWINMGISIVLGLIKDSFKNAESKEQFRRALLKIRNEINNLYAGDPDFEKP